MHGCGWDSGAARERSSALAASVASRYAFGADGVGAARPGARGSRVTASRYALGTEARRRGRCAPGHCHRASQPQQRRLSPRALVRTQESCTRPATAAAAPGPPPSARAEEQRDQVE